MGDKKPKKKSSGNSDAHKAKVKQANVDRPPMAEGKDDKSKRSK